MELPDSNHPDSTTHASVEGTQSANPSVTSTEMGAASRGAPGTSDGGPVRKIRLARVLMLLLVIIAIAFYCYGVPRQDAPSEIVTPPAVDLAASHPAVVKVISDARASVVAEPQSAEAWGHYGMCLHAHGFEAAAIACFEQAANLDPGDYRWPYLLGISTTVAAPERGLGYFERAADLRPELVFVRLRAAELMLDLNRTAEAEAYLQDILAVEPANARASLAMARLTFARREFENSLRWAEQAVNGAPNVRSTYELLTRICFQLERKEQAQTYLSQLRALKDHDDDWPDPLVAHVMELRADPQWILFKIQQQLDSGQTQNAITALKQMVADHPEWIEFRIELAHRLLSVGDWAAVDALLDEGLRQSPQSERLHRLRGLVHYAEGDHRRAADEFRHAIRLKPDYAVAHYNLGQCLLDLGEEAEAVNEFEQALRIQPGLPGVRERLQEIAGRQDETVPNE